MKYIFISVFSLFSFVAINPAKAQFVEKGTTSDLILITATYGTGLPAGDLSDRFGLHFQIGGELHYLMKNGLVFGGGGQFIFGNNIKEDPLAGIRTSDGNIISQEREYAQVNISERGYYIGADAGYLFSFGKKRSGIRATVGGGLLYHKFRLKAGSGTVPQVEKPYVKGYDRLSSGPALRQSLVYNYLSENRLLNFYAGIECIEGFTKNRRGFNYDLNAASEESRTDIIIALKIGWHIPIYTNEADGIYY